MSAIEVKSLIPSQKPNFRLLAWTSSAWPLSAAMLDGFAAISLAAAIAQFIDLGRKLLSKRSEIRCDWAAAEVTDLELTANDLADALPKLEHPSKKVGISSTGVTSNAQSEEVRKTIHLPRIASPYVVAVAQFTCR